MASNTAAAPLSSPRRLFGLLSGRLYWRTFVLIVALLSVSLAAWFQSFRVQQTSQQIEQTARQITSLIDLTRIALVHSAPEYRNALLDELVRREDIYIYPRHPGDRWTPMERNDFTRRLAASVGARLHEQLNFADSVNGEAGLWIGFRIDRDQYWLLLDPSRLDESLGETWVVGGVLATLLALIGAAVIAGFINRPLRDLSIATARVREGDFSYQLDETSGTEEIREVNRGFNRMARALQEIEQERALMLAGISHDIRTPLARLRLEAELSVPDATARNDIIADIEQADSIINKFMEYARSASPVLQPVDLPELAQRVCDELGKWGDLRIRVDDDVQAWALADELEVRRVLTNLLENARRYARLPGHERAEVEISFLRRTSEVALLVRDRGPGVQPDQLALLTRPFFRGDTARTSGQGTGLGLAIVERTVARMHGRLDIANAPGGGLLVQVWLPRDPSDLLPAVPA
ncbi:MAG: HAMP domain-containing protein [Betaproteobacteria bacterium]|nr:HAMP domain-containing protein [Betaproteobacteria bacterium]